MKTKKENKKSLGVALPPATWEMLDKLAEKSGRSRNNYIEQVINLHLAQQHLPR